jgi:hypothetical protein
VFGLENAILWAKNWDLTERKMWFNQENRFMSRK